MTRAAAGTRQFWLRKLHSLTGFAFLGTFLCFHVRGEGTYGSPTRRALLLVLPLAFHGLYGLFITWESRPNCLRYAWLRNAMYLAQRVSGTLLVAFVPLHVGAVRWGAAYAEAAWYRAAWYAGTLAAVFHLANGLFGTAVDWGVTVGPVSQRAAVAASFASFVVLAGYGLATLASF